MKILKIKHESSGKGDDNFACSHHFSARIKSGLLSYTDTNILVYTNCSKLSLDEVVNTIVSQEKSIMREILYTLRTKNEAIAVFAGKKSFTAKIGDDDCRFYFHKYEATDYAISNPANW